MEKEKLILLIDMLEREIEEISNLPKVGHRVVGALFLLNRLKWALREEKQIDLDEINNKLEIFEEAKKKSEKDIINEIQNADSDTLNAMASIATAEIILQNQNDDEPINIDDFNQLKEYKLFLLKNGLIGKTIQTLEYDDYYAEQFQNFKILFSKNNGESMFCNYYKKVTKQELKKLIDDIKAGKIR